MKSKLLLGAAVTAAMGWTTGAQADPSFFQCSSSPLTDCVVYDAHVPAGSTDILNRTAVDWNQTGTVVAQGTGPFGSDLTDHPPITEIYQSNTVDFSGGPNIPNLNTQENGSAFLPGQFNFTTVFNFEETVESITGIFPDQTVRFGVVPGSGTVSIFYNDLANGPGVTPDHVPGTNYDSGLEVARFTIVSGVSRFSADPPAGVSGSGTATYDFEIRSPGDFVNPLYFLTSDAGLTAADCPMGASFGDLGANGCINAYHWTATLGFPDSAPPTAYTVGGSALYPDYSVVSCAGIDPDVNPNTCDLVFHVDAVGQFRSVPEIDAVAGSGAFALLGGMLMLAGERRRARKSA